MADVSGITAVRVTENTQLETVSYGATISAGQTLYLDTSDNEHKLADADGAAALQKARGIAITPSIDAGAGLIARGGSIILVGATLAVGTAYYLSDTAGGIKPAADLTTGDNVVLLGVAATTTQLDLAIRDFQITHA